MAIYLKYGDTVKGGVTTTGFVDQIMLSSVQWGVGRAIASPTGQGTNRESSVASISEVSCSKEFDKSSNGLFQEALLGKGVTAVITVTRTAQGAEDKFLEYTLTNAMISGYSVSSSGDRPSESFSINFTKISSSVTLGDATNADGTPDVVGWDLALSAKV